MSQQLEEQQDFGSQAVQGHEQKQERKGDTDAKEGGGTPPQAPPGPAPGIKKADAAAEALENFYEADDEDVAAESKKVVMALRALRPRASNYAKLKVSIEYKYQTHDVWAAIMQTSWITKQTYLQSGQLCLGTTGSGRLAGDDPEHRQAAAAGTAEHPVHVC
eukprot:jgi/Bigna1/137613/aug1.40_g12321